MVTQFYRVSDPASRDLVLAIYVASIYGVWEEVDARVILSEDNLEELSQFTVNFQEDTYLFEIMIDWH